MSQKRGAKGYSPVTAATAAKKREERRDLWPFYSPYHRPWAARKRQGGRTVAL